jgi:hypothetical protein
MEPYARGEWTITLSGGTRLRTSRAHSARLHEIIARG